MQPSTKISTFYEHFTNILTKANQRLYILRMLKRIMTKKELWNIYESLIRSILEYAAPMFVKLPKYLIKKLERNQKRAHNIICGYEHTCECIIANLEDRRLTIRNKLNNKIKKNKSHILHKYIQRSLPSIRTNKRRDSFFNDVLIKDEYFS